MWVMRLSLLAQEQPSERVPRQLDPRCSHIHSTRQSDVRWAVDEKCTHIQPAKLISVRSACAKRQQGPCGFVCLQLVVRPRNLRASSSVRSEKHVHEKHEHVRRHWKRTKDSKVKATSTQTEDQCPPSLHFWGTQNNIPTPGEGCLSCLL